jgi:hypothetical protein
MARTAVQKTSSEIPIKIPAIVNLPIRQALGIGDGRTLSVVKDMPRRSPVSIGRRLREVHDSRKGSLHGPHRGTARIHSRGLGHLRAGIERHKFTQFR